MNFKKIQYDSEAVRNTLQKGKMDPNCAAHLLKKEISDSNVIYFFYNDCECKYVGETETSLWERCTKHTPPEINSAWFNECNNIFILLLDDNMDTIARQALESSFIVTLSRAGHGLYNIKG